MRGRVFMNRGQVRGGRSMQSGVGGRRSLQSGVGVLVNSRTFGDGKGVRRALALNRHGDGLCGGGRGAEIFGTVPRSTRGFASSNASEYDGNLRSSPSITSSQKRSRFGVVTVSEGERVALWDIGGKMSLVDGPRRLLMFGGSIEPLTLHVASPTEFIRIMNKDGTKQYKYGPASVWFNPLEHDEIKVYKALTLNSNEGMVVYREKDQQVSRRVVYGPQVHFPEDNEWLHNFVWHGRDERAPPGLNRKAAGKLVFTKLRLIPDQLYFDVESVRSADDALLTIKLMIFFELTDVDKMIDSTHDAPSDFINSISADVIQWTGKRSFEQFKQEATALNELTTYAQLLARTKQIGYNVSKVVFRGYLATDKLQTMHDDAIETRTSLVLQQETERTAQQLADFKLEKEMARKQEQRTLEELEQLHRLKLDNLNLQASLMKQKQLASQSREHRKLDASQDLEERSARSLQEREHFAGLRSLGVDLTQYFVAKEQTGARIIKVESGKGVDQATMPRVHLHETVASDKPK
eukprot:gb/GEZN01004992.1/.p1 GENE.gb/GEZN01004992.1/~~gb/GEZN01004992.1/.p1  ORF type:complete len:522 (-),score=73.36 gb/GEZN01004992.1/:215-1780(-)